VRPSIAHDLRRVADDALARRDIADDDALPAPVAEPSPSVTGATSDEFEPTKTSAPIVVRSSSRRRSCR
jgi:hypothetical protein